LASLAGFYKEIFPEEDERGDIHYSLAGFFHGSRIKYDFFKKNRTIPYLSLRKVPVQNLPSMCHWHMGPTCVSGKFLTRKFAMAWKIVYQNLSRVTKSAPNIFIH
jgi:hypothetical protein